MLCCVWWILLIRSNTFNKSYLWFPDVSTKCRDAGYLQIFWFCDDNFIFQFISFHPFNHMFIWIFPNAIIFNAFFSKNPCQSQKMIWFYQNKYIIHFHNSEPISLCSYSLNAACLVEKQIIQFNGLCID